MLQTHDADSRDRLNRFFDAHEAHGKVRVYRDSNAEAVTLTLRCPCGDDEPATFSRATVRVIGVLAGWNRMPIEDVPNDEHLAMAVDYEPVQLTPANG